MRCFTIVLVSVAVLAVPPLAQARTWHVPSECLNIQAGIDSASIGDTVLVAGGVYHDCTHPDSQGGINCVVLKSGVVLQSETTQADCATIDAEGNGRVFFCSEVDNTTLEGFTIVGGAGHHCGGGMYCRESSPTLRNCVFIGNSAATGGGLHCSTGSSPALSRVGFSYNSAEHGGGMSCEALCAPSLTECVFSGNSAGWGGGLHCSSGSPAVLVDVVFRENSGTLGGALFCTHSSPLLNTMLFEANSATLGGALFLESESYPSISELTLVANSASESGAGIYLEDQCIITLQNCIVAFSQQGEGVCVGTGGGASSITLTCCDLFGNAGGDWVGTVADQYDINGNISEDPLFCGDANPEQPYTLRSDSPCAPENNRECGLIGAWPVGCEPPMATEHVTWSSVKALYR